MGVVFVYTAALLVTIGAFITGYGIGSVNGLQNFVGFLETFGLLGNTSTVNSSDTSECNQPSDLPAESLLILGALSSSLAIGGSLATFTSGKPVDLFGRKTMLIVSGILTVVGGAIQTASFHSWTFLVGRLICGYAYGIVYTAAPVYIAEISPMKIRGRVTALVGPTITFGILSGYVVNFLLNGEVFGWRVSRALICVMGAVYIIALAFLPRSPRWLVLRKKEVEAEKVLRRTLSLDDYGSIPLEIATIKKSLSVEKRSFRNEMRVIFNLKTIKRIILGGLLHGLASLSGNYVFHYSEILFCSFGIMPFVTLIVVGVCSFSGTIFTPSIIDKVGRKCLLLAGGLIMAALNGLSGTLILNFNLEEERNEVVSYTVVCLVCMFVVIFSATWYVLPIVVTGEVFPPEVRAVGNGVSSVCYWAMASIFSQLFPYIFSLLRSYGTLYLIGCINIVAVLYCLLFLPETKGVSLEDMDKLFTKSCFIGLSRCRCCVSDDPGAHVQSPNQVDPEIPSVSSTLPLTDLVTEHKTTKRNDHGFLCTSV